LFVFGKHFKQCDFTIDEPTISNQHFILDYHPDYGWCIYEYDTFSKIESYYGTYVLLANDYQVVNRLPSYP
jgi:hypothetical protein